jgi:hypothetical protein
MADRGLNEQEATELAEEQGVPHKFDEFVDRCLLVEVKAVGCHFDP